MPWCCFVCGIEFQKGRHTELGSGISIDFQYCEACYTTYKILRLLHDKRSELSQHLTELAKPEGEVT